MNILERRTPFFVLWRTFLGQFFTSQSVASDDQLHQSYVWVAVFLLVPGTFMLIQLFPDFQSAVILAHLGRAPLSVIDDFLVWIALFLTTYSMVAAGFLTVLAWDGLSFDRRDAMVLGSLPVSSTTLIGAKLAALGTLLLTLSFSIAVINAVVFALITSDQLGALVFVRHLVSMFVAASGSAIFIIASIVLLRAVVLLVGGATVADACGPALQFTCVVLVLCLIFLSPAVWQVSFVTASLTGWMPPAWFAGTFEFLRHSPRAADPAFPFMVYQQRAVVGLVLAVGGALLFSLAEFGRQMRAAVIPLAGPGVAGRAIAGQRVARLFSGRNAIVKATSRFALTTLVRNRRLHLPIAVHAAVGAAVIVIGFSRNVTSLDGLLRPRTAVLWIPLVMGYWIAAGVRASFFIPCELPAAWTFRTHPAGGEADQRRAARAAMLGFVIPRVLLLCLGLIPALGWALAFRHMAAVSGVMVIVTAMMSLGLRHQPFTRAFEPGHARLRTWWVVYAFGMYAAAYWPARIEVSLLANGGDIDRFVAIIWMTAVAVEIAFRFLPARPHTDLEEAGDSSGISVLDLAGAQLR